MEFLSVLSADAIADIVYKFVEPLGSRLGKLMVHVYPCSGFRSSPVDPSVHHSQTTSRIIKANNNVTGNGGQFNGPVTGPRWSLHLYMVNPLEMPMTLGFDMKHQRCRACQICANDDDLLNVDVKFVSY